MVDLFSKIGVYSVYWFGRMYTSKTKKAVQNRGHRMIKTRQETIIDVGDWDALVEKTYGRRYSFQQQDGCKERQHVHISVPDNADDYENDTVPEKVNHPERGVSFKAWLERDPDQLLSNSDDQKPWSLELWWERNFYPDVQMIANDLHERGLLEAGEYVIDIDW